MKAMQVGQSLDSAQEKKEEKPMRVFANVTVNLTLDDIADLEKNGSVSNYGYVVRLIKPRREFEPRREREEAPEEKEEPLPKKRKPSA